MAEQMYYKVSQVAELLGISRSAAYELVREGVIPAVHLGGMLRVSRRALEELDERLSGQAQQEATY